MAIRGSTKDISLPEFFQFIGIRKRTGLLTVFTSSSASKRSPALYIWFDWGQVVAVANQLDNRGLLSLICQHQWLSDRVIEKLASICPTEQALGMYLQGQGALEAKHLQQLFQAQVLQQVRTLSALEDIRFKFEADVPAPSQERTGLTLAAEFLSHCWENSPFQKVLEEASQNNLNAKKMMKSCSLYLS
jgi:hypothetical protein